MIFITGSRVLTIPISLASCPHDACRRSSHLTVRLTLPEGEYVVIRAYDLAVTSNAILIRLALPE